MSWSTSVRFDAGKDAARRLGECRKHGIGRQPTSGIRSEADDPADLHATGARGSDTAWDPVARRSRPAAHRQRRRRGGRRKIRTPCTRRWAPPRPHACTDAAASSDRFPPWSTRAGSFRPDEMRPTRRERRPAASRAPRRRRTCTARLHAQSNAAAPSACRCEHPTPCSAITEPGIQPQMTYA